ncbi:MAG: DUF4127 family protein [Phototrophicaceae bacterium]
MQIALVPLDERPANTRYPQMIAAMGRAHLILPPSERLSHFRDAASPDGLAQWIQDVAPTSDALIVSIEMLVYGGLIASRIGHEPLEVLRPRLTLLRDLHRQYPNLKIYAFNVITRISRHNDATEEPDYWAAHGNALFQLSQAMHRVRLGIIPQESVDIAAQAIPPDHIADFTARRKRNNAINRTVLELAGEGVFDLLVLSSDDTSEFGLGAEEKRQLATIATTLGLGDDRLLMYPGADEVGSVLVARLLLQAAERQPKIEPFYLVEQDIAAIAPFEDVPIYASVSRQIKAVGATEATEGGDVLLVVNPPVSSTAEWVTDQEGDAHLIRRLVEFNDKMLQLYHQTAGWCCFAVADVAYANGGSMELVRQLSKYHLFGNIGAYSAWNTAGNTLGTTLAHSVLWQLPNYDAEAGKRFLAHRWLEDWGYQTLNRHKARLWLWREHRTHELRPDLIPELSLKVEHWLTTAGDLIGLNYRAVNVRFPWGRTFEVDFDLVPR